MHQDCLSFAISWSVLKFFSIELLMLSNHLFLCLIFLLPSIFPGIRVFSNELALCIRWPKCWSFSFFISPSNEYSGSISFRNDLFDLLAAQGTLKSLLQHHSSKASILWCSAFFMVQLSHPCMATRKNSSFYSHIFLGSKITADGDCNHEIKRCLLLGKKAMTNLDSILKSRDITLPTKAHLVKATVFPVVMNGSESWTIKKTEHQRIDALNCGVGEDS